MNIDNNNNKVDSVNTNKEDEGNIWNLLNEYHGIKKVAMAPIVGVVYASVETIKIADKIKIGDKSVWDRWVDMQADSQKEKEEHPMKWAAKKVIKSAIFRTIFPK